MNPNVSVIIATFNRAEFIGAAISSVIEQTYTDFELIVVDDGSNDDTPDIVKAFVDPRIRFLRRPHCGLGATLNFGLRAATGRFIARNDSDDVWLPTLLQTLVPLLDVNPELGLVYGRCDVVGRDLSAVVGSRGAPLRYPDDAFRSLLYSDSSTSIASLYRKSAVESAGGWNEQRRWNDDWGLALRVTRHAPATYTDALVAKVRRHPGNITAESATSFDERLSSREGVLDETFALPNLSDAALAMRPIAYRNLYTVAGMQKLLAGRRMDAIREFRRAIAVSDSRFGAVAYIAWTALGWFGIGRLPPAARLARGAIAWARRSAWVGVFVLSISCTATRHWAFPTEGYAAVGEPSLTFEAARAECLEETEFESGGSHYRGHNWNRFEACMATRGYARPAD